MKLIIITKDMPVGKKGFQRGHKPFSDGRSVLGKHWKLTEKTKKRQSIAKKGKKHYGYGKHLSEEHKRKISIATQKKNSGSKCGSWRGGVSHGFRKKEHIRKFGKNESCEICGSKRKICFDHDHKTGEFRGWLCWYCNCALGFVRDDVTILEKMIKYLKK